MDPKDPTWGHYGTREQHKAVANAARDALEIFLNECKGKPKYLVLVDKAAFRAMDKVEFTLVDVIL